MINNGRKFLFALLALGTVFIGSQAYLTFAQEVEKKHYGIVITPAVFHKTMNPGESYRDLVRITNDFEHRETVTYYTRTGLFKQDGETGNPDIFFDEELPVSANASQWVTFDNSEHELEYGEMEESGFTVDVPENAEPGGHYIALVFSDEFTEEQLGEEEGAVALGKTIVALFFLTVTGDVEEDGQLLEFYADKKVYEFLPVNFTIRYENTGNVHTQIGGNIFITRENESDQVDALVVNEDVGLTLPGSVRRYEEIYEDGWITLGENGELIIDNGKFPKIYFGKYNAILRMRHTVDGERVTAERTVSFWVIPWRLILAGLGVILAIYLLRRFKKYLQRRLKERKKKPKQKDQEI